MGSQTLRDESACAVLAEGSGELHDGKVDDRLQFVGVAAHLRLVPRGEGWRNDMQEHFELHHQQLVPRE